MKGLLSISLGLLISFQVLLPVLAHRGSGRIETEESKNKSVQKRWYILLHNVVVSRIAHFDVSSGYKTELDCLRALRNITAVVPNNVDPEMTCGRR